MESLASSSGLLSTQLRCVPLRPAPLLVEIGVQKALLTVFPWESAESHFGSETTLQPLTLSPINETLYISNALASVVDVSAKAHVGYHCDFFPLKSCGRC